ncbi:hypothetical protein [uncultured Chloroflexus sp.]|uniref:LuxR C-terminal-related transcriptional regulator n=1 Tax=uncultured Chloroflexus sp. TaxID=214040 RepID=UPI00260879D4|nr:hypothetical protein [uncultured Chloroflexus sp.]
MHTSRSIRNGLTPELQSEVQDVAERLRHVPPRLRKIAQYIWYVPKEIAKKIDLSEATVRTYINDLYHQLGLKDNRKTYHLDRTIIVALAMMVYMSKYDE